MFSLAITYTSGLLVHGILFGAAVLVWLLLNLFIVAKNYVLDLDWDEEGYTKYIQVIGLSGVHDLRDLFFTMIALVGIALISSVVWPLIWPILVIVGILVGLKRFFAFKKQIEKMIDSKQ